MKRDHLMGYTGHLDALFGKEERLSVRTPIRPPQIQADIDIRRMQDRVETHKLTQAHALAQSIEQSRLNREGKNIGGIKEYVAHMHSGSELMPYQKSILANIEEAIECSGGEIKLQLRIGVTSDNAPDYGAPCACGAKPASACPGAWEPGCDLGANAKHARSIDVTDSHYSKLDRDMGFRWRLAPGVVLAGKSIRITDEQYNKLDEDTKGLYEPI